MAEAAPSPMGAHMALVRGQVTIRSARTCSGVTLKVYWALGFSEEW